MADNPYKKTPFPAFKPVSKLKKKDALLEAALLREAINYHDHLYYIKNKPAIADSEYDKLFHRLENLEEEFPEVESEISPTKRVGSPPVDKLKKRKHKSPMLSLKSSAEHEDIRKFLDNLKKNNNQKLPELVLEPKFDGLSVEVVYTKGTFEYAATRGDGETGEDISENIKTISSLPLQLQAKNNVPAFFAVRGEVFMEKEGFRKLNKQRIENGEESFANARNAAAGTLRQLDSKKVAGKPLDIYFYDILSASEDVCDSHWDMLKKLTEWGLKVNMLFVLPDCLAGSS